MTATAQRSATWSTYYEKHHASLEGYAKFLLGDRFKNDVDDVLQETWIKIYVGLKKGPHPRRFQPWALRILRNEFYNHARAERAEKRGGENSPIHLDGADLGWDGIHGEWADYYLGLVESEESMRVRRAVVELPPLFAWIIVMRFYDGMTLDAVGQLIGVRASTVLRNQSRALDMLRRVLRRRNYRG